MSSTKQRFWQVRLITGAAVVGARGLATTGIAPPAFAAGSYLTLAASNFRSDSSARSTIVKTVARGMTRAIDCCSNGQNSLNLSIWNHVPTYNGYVSDSLLLTGSTAHTTASFMNGNTAYHRGCLKFAVHAYGKMAAGYNPAMGMYQALKAATQIHTGTSPWGRSYSVTARTTYTTASLRDISLAIVDGLYVVGGVIPTSSCSRVAVFIRAIPASNSTVLGWVDAPTYRPSS